MKLFGRRKSAASPLLKAPAKSYIPVQAPNTDIMSMMNPQWLDVEMRSHRPPQLTLALADDVAVRNVDENRLGPEIKDLTEACLDRVSPKMRPILRSGTFDAVVTGVACALLEEASGQQRPGLMHPSIANALRFAGMGEPGGVPADATFVFDKAREGGYFWMRNRQVSPSRVFESCSFDI